MNFTAARSPVLPATAASAAPATGQSSSHHANIARRTYALVLWLPVILALAFIGHLRWKLARDTPWQCDEVPLLVRSTGLCGLVSNEAEAAAFRPTFYSFYMGAARSLRCPKALSAIHTSTAFWTNLTVHLFGCEPWAGRLAPLAFSLIASAMSGWAAWLLFRRVEAVCLAVLIVLLSPAGTAYAAQSRGYAEVAAGAPALLISIELVRRSPLRIGRVTALFAIALLLALTVYTTWVYFVLPALLTAIVMANQVKSVSDRRAYRAVLILVTVGLVTFMIFYTLERLDYLLVSARQGSPLSSTADAMGFTAGAANALVPLPLVIIPAALTGGWVLWRSPFRWWVVVSVAGVVIPGLFALFTGSAGHVRNLIYVLPISAVFAAGGLVFLFDRAVRGRQGYYSSASVICASVLLVGICLPGLEAQSVAMLPADWGGMVRRIQREPARFGPRWFCECLAGHWPIGWYRGPLDTGAILSRRPGETIEVILSAPLNEEGSPNILAVGPTRPTIIPRPLPRFLHDKPADRTFRGLEVRRWVGTMIELEDLRPQPPDRIVFAFCAHPAAGQEDAWEIDLRLAGMNLIAFRTHVIGDREVRTFIAPANEAAAAITMIRESSHEKGDVRVFTLGPLDSF